MAKIQHQITLVAFHEDETGKLTVYDVIETSFKNASFFARGFLRQPDITHLQASQPGAPLWALTGAIRPIR